MPNPDSARIAKKRARNAAARERKGTTESSTGGDGAGAAEGDNAASKAPKAYLELKTYDPESGVTLKYRTDKAAEVGRLVASLGRLGRHMAALPAVTEGEHVRIISWTGTIIDTLQISSWPTRRQWRKTPMARVRRNQRRRRQRTRHRDRRRWAERRAERRRKRLASDEKESHDEYVQYYLARIKIPSRLDPDAISMRKFVSDVVIRV